MKLSEFVKKRREELGLTWNNIADGGIAHNTFSKIVNDKQLTMQPATMEKLARVLKCSMGDIQACMAEIPSPLREEAEKPEGNAGISITAGAGKSRKKVAPAPDPKDEEPAEVFKTDKEVEVDMMFPVEEVEETVEEYKGRLMYKVGRILRKTKHELTDGVRQELGNMLLDELFGGGDDHEN